MEYGVVCAGRVGQAKRSALALCSLDSSWNSAGRVTQTPRAFFGPITVVTQSRFVSCGTYCPALDWHHYVAMRVASSSFSSSSSSPSKLEATSRQESTYPFCPLCGTILDPPTSEHVKCTVCPYSHRFADLHIQEVTTRTPARPKPTWVADNEDGITTGQDAHASLEKHAKIDEPCPKCSHPELYFYTMQLRSVDEGSTVFYECAKCGHKFSQNN